MRDRDLPAAGCRAGRCAFCCHFETWTCRDAQGFPGANGSGAAREALVQPLGLHWQQLVLPARLALLELGSTGRAWQHRGRICPARTELSVCPI